jgi:glutamate synthase domain-containing protein 1
VSHIPYRYFFKPDPEKLLGRKIDEKDAILKMVMDINASRSGALVFSSGKNMGIFKASAWPEEVGNFYMVNKYKGYLWLGHNRYPTNTRDGGAAHTPSGCSTGASCTMERLPHTARTCAMWKASGIRAPCLPTRRLSPISLTSSYESTGSRQKWPARPCPRFWNDIDRMAPNERDVHTALRLAYASASMNGPFAIVVGNTGGFVALTDRIKLRPLVMGYRGKTAFVSSEEAAIRAMEPNLDRVYHPPAGTPVVERLEGRA